MNARPLTSTILVLLCAVACGLVMYCAPALAARGHVLTGAFGEPCASEPCGPGQFKEPVGVAVNEASGYVYVLDRSENRVQRFSSTGAYEAQFSGSETPAKAFAFGTGTAPYANGLIGGIAVDNSCYLKKLSGGACAAADPSNGDVYVIDPGNSVVDKFSAQGAYIGQLQGESGAPFEFGGLPGPGGRLESYLDGVGVDANGKVWVYFGGDTSNGLVDSFTNAEQSVFVSSQSLNCGQRASCFNAPGFAIDSEDNFYARVGDASDPAPSLIVTKYSTTLETTLELTLAAPLIEPFVNEETSAVAVDLSTNEVFLDNVGSIGALSKDGVLQERFGSGHLVGGSGLAVSHANATVYVADSTVGIVNIFSPEPPSAPTVEGVSVSGVAGESATLEAALNPRGASTEYHFEYGTCPSVAMCAGAPFEKSVPVPDASAGSDFEVHNFSFHLQGLSTGTAYHFRVVAHNEKDTPGTTVNGEEVKFTTQPIAEGSALPDGRSWELVSKAKKQGALILPIIEGGPTQAAVGGGAMTYLAAAPTEGEPGGFAVAEQVFSRRGVDGWTSRDISLPHENPTGVSVGEGSEYRSFSEDLALSAVQPFGPFIPASSPLALAPRESSEQTAFLRMNYLNGNIESPCVSACFRPLVTGAPGYANVPEGTVFGTGEEKGQCFILACGPRYVGGSPDLSHVVISSEVPLTETPIEPGGSGLKKEALYEWSAGRLVLVSALPEGGPASSGALGSPTPSNVARNTVSDNGSRVIWTGSVGGIPHLYLRDTVRDETLQLDSVQGGSGAGEPETIFQTASRDGSQIFFTDKQHLTADSGQQGNEKERDLYKCEIVEEAKKMFCGLSDLTPSTSGKGADVGGQVLGASSNGSWLYFVASGVLAPGAVPGNCATSRTDATCNLYVWHEGATKLVSVLSAKDEADWAYTLSGQSARVSPNGEWLTFMSQRELTGYNNHDVASGKPDQEVYLYHAGTVADGSLVCASCNPTGARPTGVESKDLNGSLVDHSNFRESDQSVAANVPGWTGYSGTGNKPVQVYQSRYLSDSGRLFFNSADALVPQDVDGTWDVYEYEPLGVGSCASTSVSFGVSSDGCVGLVSSGSSSEESAFLDASETGGDVFFLTEAKLVSGDFDSALDVYDAHECRNLSPCFASSTVVPPPCTTGDSCKASPSPQPAIFGSPASATFSGVGNLTPSGQPKRATKSKRATRAQRLARALGACDRQRSARRRAVCRGRARSRFAARRSDVSASKRGRG